MKKKFHQREQKSKFGKFTNAIVNTDAKVSTLSFLHHQFFSREEGIRPFTIEEFLESKRISFDKKRKNKNVMRIKRLVKNEWLRKPNKEGKILPSQKFKNYIENYNDFSNPNAPLMKSKEPRIVEVKEVKEVEKLRREIDKQTFLGEA